MLSCCTFYVRVGGEVLSIYGPLQSATHVSLQNRRRFLFFTVSASSNTTCINLIQSQNVLFIRNLSLLESLLAVELRYLEVNDHSNSPLFLTQIIFHWIYVFSLLIRSNYIFVEDEALKIIKIISFRSKNPLKRSSRPKPVRFTQPLLVIPDVKLTNGFFRLRSLISLPVAIQLHNIL